MISPYPLCFYPIYTDYVWGGNRIITKYKRKKKFKIHAESWEVCDRQNVRSVIKNGPLRGKDLRYALTLWKNNLLGRGKKRKKFPLLVKIIDAKQRLSLQVHPDVLVAKKFNAEAKSECWYVLETRKNSLIYAGLNPKFTKEELKNIILDSKNCEHVVNKIKVKKEDMIFIPAGRIHALGENNLILEVQQNSNTTYRIYDWGREEKNRPLHIKEAISALHWQDKKDPLVERHLTQTAAEFQLYSMLSCKYFALSLLKLKKRVILNLPGKNFIIFFVENGYGDLRYEKHKIKLKPGTTCLLPAHCRNITLSNSTKNLSLVLIAEKTLKKLSVLSG